MANNNYCFRNINNSGLVLKSSSLFPGLLRHKGPELVNVDGGVVVLVSLEVEVSLTLLAEIAGVVFVHVYSVVVHATSLTSSRRMLSVLSNSTVTVRDVTSKLPGLSQPCNLSLI